MSTQPIHQEIALTPSLLRIDFAKSGKKLPKKAKAATSSSIAANKTAGRRKPVAKKARATKSAAKPRVRHEKTTERPATLQETLVAVDEPIVEPALSPTFEAVPDPIAPVADFAVAETVPFPEAETAFASEPSAEAMPSFEVMPHVEVQPVIEIPLSVQNAEIVPAIPEQIAAEIEKKAFRTVFWNSVTAFFLQAWNWAQQRMKSHQVRKRLRVCETVSLGEKRFVAVIQVDGQQFLVGGSSTSVSTLAQLEPARDFSDVLQRSCEQGLSQA